MFNIYENTKTMKIFISLINIALNSLYHLTITLLSNKVIDYNWFKAEYMKNPKQMDKEGDECWFNRWKIDLSKIDVND